MTVAEFIEAVELLRTTGDILADELSVLNHTTGISGRARDALEDWDQLSFPLRTKLREANGVLTA
jgi:hypothetical protein